MSWNWVLPSRRVVHLLLSACASANLFSGCSLEPTTAGSSGVELNDATPDAGSSPLRGYAVVGSDYASASIALLSPTGNVVSPVLISSASKAPGLSAALTGDVAFSSSRQRGDELVLIDRYPASVLTWVNLETAHVRAQLSVATGFASNPQDYVPYSATKAFVTRYEPNLNPGSEPFDEGDDVLVIDPSVPEIVERIELDEAFENEDGTYHARPDGAVLVGGLLRVMALGFNLDFTERMNSRLISIDPTSHAIEHVLILKGMNSCVMAVPSPSGEELAIACYGAFGQDPSDGFVDSGVVLVGLEDKPKILERWTSQELGIGQISTVEWINEDELAVLTFGRFSDNGPDVPDTVRSLNVRRGKLGRIWLETGPFALGDIACDLSRSTCLLADAETEGGLIHVFDIALDTPKRKRGVKLEGAAGLPPRGFGRF